MIESRCGLLCSSCSYKETFDCQGCTNICKPFWGDQCTVKICCEEKKHAHCGACSLFPCTLLKSFAYDPEQGDDGQRIEQCKTWAKDEEI